MIAADLLFKALSDQSRLDILRLLAGGPKHVELIAEACSLSDGTVSFHLKKLELAGLVRSRKEQYYRSYSLVPRAFETSLKEIIGLKVESQHIEAEENYKKKVLSSFIRLGQLKTIPVQKKKRLIVLEELAQQFHTDREYPETEVNRILLQWNEDFCTLRRELVSYGFMKRKKGVYSRSEIK